MMGSDNDDDGDDLKAYPWGLASFSFLDGIDAVAVLIVKKGI